MAATRKDISLGDDPSTSAAPTVVMPSFVARLDLEEVEGDLTVSLFGFDPIAATTPCS